MSKAVITEPRYCAFTDCGKQLIPGAKENAANFRTRKYCGHRCAASAQRKPIKHGTPGGARTHRNRGEKPCAECLPAERQYQREHREANPEIEQQKRRTKTAQRRARNRLADRHRAEYLALFNEELQKTRATA